MSYCIQSLYRHNRILRIVLNNNSFSKINFVVTQVSGDDKIYGQVKVKQPLYSLEWPRGFQEVKVPRFHDNGTGWW